MCVPAVFHLPIQMKRKLGVRPGVESSRRQSPGVKVRLKARLSDQPRGHSVRTDQRPCPGGRRQDRQEYQPSGEQGVKFERYLEVWGPGPSPLVD